MRLSLRKRIFLVLMVPLVVLAAAVGAARYAQAQRMLAQLYDNTLLTIAFTISRDVVRSEGDVLTESLLDSLTRALGDPIYYQVRASGGGFITGYSSPPPIPTGVELEGGVPFFYDSVSEGRRVRAVIIREFIANPEFDGWTTVTVWQTVVRRAAIASQFGRETLALLASVVAAAGLLLWFAIQFGLKPLHDLRDAIGQRSDSDLQPIRRWVPPELAEVVHTTNSLFERLSAAFALRDNFIADAAHQLRNPVAAIQSQAEAALSARSPSVARTRLLDLIATVRQLGRLTNQLLALERARGGAPKQFVPVDLGAIARDQTTRLAEQLLPRGVTFSFDQIGDARPIMGDAVMIEEMIQNLLDNAVKHGLGNDANIQVTVSFEKDHAILSVLDSGPGVPHDLHERVFDRFFRGGVSDKEGSGLGLAIVREIAIAHGGNASLVDLSFGCRIKVLLPVTSVGSVR